MAFDAYMKIGTIRGESTDKNHEEWIQLLSYSHGLSNAVSGSASRGGGGSEGVEHAKFSIVKALDKASPKLNLACCNGEDLDTVTIELCRASGEKQVYMKYVMEAPVKVTSVCPGGSSKGGADVPLEEVSFDYGKMTWTYTELDNKGAAKGDIEAFWDTTSNAGG